MSPPQHLNRGLVKMGDFQDMARARKKKRRELASLKAQRLATKAASTAETVSLELQFAKRLVECDACGEMHTKRGLSQHKRRCGLKLKEKHRATCCMCGERGHLTPLSKFCTSEAKAAWADLASDSTPDRSAGLMSPGQRRMYEKHYTDLREKYQPQEILSPEPTDSEIAGVMHAVRIVTSSLLPGEDSIDILAVQYCPALGTVCEFVLNENRMVTRVVSGTATDEAGQLRKGFTLLSVNGDDVRMMVPEEIELLIRMKLSEVRAVAAAVEPDGMPLHVTLRCERAVPTTPQQGWACQPPRRKYPKLKPVQLEFLWRFFVKPGAMPPINTKIDTHCLLY